MMRFAAVFFFVNSLAAQTSRTPTDGKTPKALEPGAAAGSYALSGFETVNLYNGSLSFRLPVLEVSGRGEAGYTVYLPIENKWEVATNELTTGGYSYGFRPDTVAVDELFWPLRIDGRVGQTGSLACSGFGGPIAAVILTRLRAIFPDGSELELVDNASGGKTLVTNCLDHASGQNTGRGTDWVAKDGSATTLRLASAIKDPTSIGALFTGAGSGKLYGRDGMTYSFEGPKVNVITDRNGNKVTVNNDTSGRVESIIDSAGRTYSFSWATDTVTITRNGYQGSARPVTVRFAKLRDRVHGTQFSGKSCDVAPSATNFGPDQVDLFGATGNENTCPNPAVASEVQLPDSKKYEIYYNDYAEVARVVLPTGGAVEYTWGTGASSCFAADDGCPKGLVSNGNDKAVYRRVKERREYWGGGTGASPDRKTTFSAQANGASETLVIVKEYASGSTTPVAERRHYFFGNPETAQWQAIIFPSTYYSQWNEGKEHQTEWYDGAGVLLRRIKQEWAQRATPSWWNVNLHGPEPANDPRVTSEDAVLPDGRLARKSYTYPTDASDNTNNIKTVTETDYGTAPSGATPAAPGTALRKIEYEYHTDSTFTAIPVHLRNLRTRETINRLELQPGSNPPQYVATIRTDTKYEYDTYAQGEPTAITNLAQHTAPATGVKRGNVTKISRWLDRQSKWLDTIRGYDTAGNMTSEILPRDHAVTGPPASPAKKWLYAYGEACASAFQTLATNPLSQSVTTVNDCNLGRPVSVTDAAGVQTTFVYDDPLDRIKRVEEGAGSTESKVTAFSYDPGGVLGVRVEQSLKAAAGGRVTEQQWDKFGRVIKSIEYEGAAASPVTTETQYDTLGRVWRVSNPSRGSASQWTTTSYDALDRVTRVQHPDGSAATWSPVNDKVTYTDEAGNVWERRYDGLGRLKSVKEYSGEAGGQEETTYTYDEATG